MTIRVWSDHMSIRIWSGPYAYGPNTDLVWNTYIILHTRFSYSVESIYDTDGNYVFVETNSAYNNVTIPNS